jgi:predicted RNA binding protein YcfA (HicA-like mRNA interferase family)
MSFAPHVWAQLKNLTCDEIIAALKKERIYRKPPNRVSIHYHPQKTYGPKMLKGLLDDIGWTEAQMRKLKLIK